MARRTSLIALAGLACALAAGCGEDAQRDVAKPAKPRPAKVNVEQFLMQTGEVPGFKPVGPPTTDSVVESFGMTPAGIKLARRSGFVSNTFQRITSEDGNAGVTNVALFKTDAGAQAWMKYESSTEFIRDQIPDVKIRRFTVPDIPGARGWTGLDLHGNRIGHVFWVQGRCMLLIGDEGTGDFVEPLSNGAKAIHARTNGACPR